MERRDYLTHTAPLAGVSGLAGCGLLGSNDGEWNPRSRRREMQAGLRENVNRIRCRSVAPGEASGHWQTWAQPILDRGPEEDIARAETEACLTLNSCTEDQNRACE